MDKGSTPPPSELAPRFISLENVSFKLQKRTNHGHFKIVGLAVEKRGQWPSFSLIVVQR